MAGQKVHRHQMATLREGGAEREQWVLTQYVGNGLTMRKIVEALDVSSRAFYEWLHEDPDRWKRWQEAKKVRAEVLAEETLEIADNVAQDPDAIAKAGLKIKGRQWLAKVLNPEAFGDQKNLTVQIGELHLTAVKAINATDTARRLAEARIKEPAPAQIEGADYEIVEDVDDLL